MKAALNTYLDSITWLLSTIVRIFAKRPISFGIVSALMVVQRVTNFLTMILPLKVILLATHNGVPAYTPFIDPAHKDIWIYALASGTVLAFFLAQGLDALTERLCDNAGGKIMKESADLSIVPNQRERASGFFGSLASIVADTVFWGAGMVLYFILVPTTAFVYLGLVVFSFALGSFFVIIGERAGMGGAHRLITERSGAYIAVNKALLFFVVFIVILYPVLARVEANMLSALISVMLLRRSLSGLTGAVRQSIRLSARRQLVDTLMFRNRRYESRRDKGHETLEAMFNQTKRRELAQEMLPAVSGGLDRMIWMDPAVGNVYQFAVSSKSGERHLLQVYPENRRHYWHNEDALFAVVPRAALGAPALVAETEHGDFHCRLVTAGEGRPMEPGEWRDAMAGVRQRILSVVPSEDLVEIFRSTHRFAHEKLTDEFISRIRVALATDRERKQLRQFTEQIPEIAARIARLPLTLSNHEFHRMTAFAGGEALPLQMYWGRWSLEPLGGGLMAGLGANEAAQSLADLRMLRQDIPDDVTLDDLYLVSNIQYLVSHIERSNFSAAMATIRDILEPAGEPREREMLASAELEIAE